MHSVELLQQWRQFVENEDKAQEDAYRKSINNCSPQQLEQRGFALVDVGISRLEPKWHGSTLVTFDRLFRENEKSFAPFKNGDKLEVRHILKDFQLDAKEQILFSSFVTSAVMYRGITDSHQQKGKVGVTVMMETEDLAKLHEFEWKLKEPEDSLSNAAAKWPRYLLVVARCDVTYQRRMAVISALSKPLKTTDRQFALYNCLISGAKSTTEYCDRVNPLGILNETQNSVVNFCVQTSPVSCIQGPPGTGKTTTVAALIKLFVQRKKRVLVAAASNVAIDNVLEKCLNDVKCVRVGHVSRVADKLQSVSMEAKCRESPRYPLLQLLLADLRKSEEQLKAVKSSMPVNEPLLSAMKKERAKLLKEIIKTRKDCWVDVFNEAQVVVATCTGCMAAPFKHYFNLENDRREERLFDVVIVDEAGQVPEIDTWMAVLLGKRVILAGDIQQLGPTVLSRKSESFTVGGSMLTRLVAANPGISRTITVQYRMNKQIMQWSSINFYQGKLEAHPSVADQQVAKCLPPMLWLDTSAVALAREDKCKNGNNWKGKKQFKSKEDPFDSSKSNAAEAALVLHYLKTKIVPYIDTIESIAIISPYNKQVRSIQDQVSSAFASKKSRVLDKIEVASVDGFQGREKTVVIISLVRSNFHKQIGFLSDAKRLNVALTRAEKHCVVIGNTQTVLGDPTFESIVSYVKSIKNFHSALKYISLPVWTTATQQIIGRRNAKPQFLRTGPQPASQRSPPQNSFSLSPGKHDKSTSPLARKACDTSKPQNARMPRTTSAAPAYLEASDRRTTWKPKSELDSQLNPRPQSNSKPYRKSKANLKPQPPKSESQAILKAPAKCRQRKLADPLSAIKPSKSKLPRALARYSMNSEKSSASLHSTSTTTVPQTDGSSFSLKESISSAEDDTYPDSMNRMCDMQDALSKPRKGVKDKELQTPKERTTTTALKLKRRRRRCDMQDALSKPRKGVKDKELQTPKERTTTTALKLKRRRRRRRDKVHQ